VVLRAESTAIKVPLPPALSMTKSRACTYLLTLMPWFAEMFQKVA
jgi:hypothetical protein